MRKWRSRSVSKGAAMPKVWGPGCTIRAQVPFICSWHRARLVLDDFQWVGGGMGGWAVTQPRRHAAAWKCQMWGGTKRRSGATGVWGFLVFFFERLFVCRREAISSRWTCKYTSGVMRSLRLKWGLRFIRSGPLWPLTVLTSISCNISCCCVSSPGKYGVSYQFGQNWGIV